MFSVPAPSRTVSWTPLVLALGLHLLLVLAWLLRPAVRVTELSPTERETMLVMVKPPRPAPAASPQPLPRPLNRSRPTPRMKPSAPPEQPTAPDAVARPEPVPASGESGAVPAPLPGELLAASRRMAGRISREMHIGSSPITTEPEQKWGRFDAMVADARAGASRSVSLDSYTAPDGVIVYRKTVGDRVRCYVSGSVGGINTADGHSAGNIACPTGVRWTRL